MTEPEISSSAWWEARRIRYNVGLVISGILAFIANSIIGTTLLPPEAGFEITVTTTLCQGALYLILMGIGNLFYYFGPASERLVQPVDPGRYRNFCFQFYFWFSVLLPFTSPALVAILALFYPELFNDPS